MKIQIISFIVFLLIMAATAAYKFSKEDSKPTNQPTPSSQKQFQFK